MNTFRMREGSDGLYYPVEDYIPLQALSNSPIIWPPRERNIMEEKLLKLIEEKPGQTVFDLARTLGENVGSVIEVLKGMVERGEIMRRTRRLNRFYPIKEEA